MRHRIFKYDHMWMLILLILVSSLSAACGEKESTDPKKDIVGTWQSEDKTWTLIFTAQDTFTSVHESEGSRVEISGANIFIDSTNQLTSVGNFLGSEVHIKGDQMTLTSDDEGEVTFTRVK